MATRVVERTTRLPFPAREVWEWHARPGALERLSPPWQRVRLVSRTGGLDEGARVELRVWAGPVPLRWVAVHRGIVPGREFYDEQVEGPFDRWVHLHRFEPDGPDACRYTDRIEYAPPFGAAGALAGRLFIHEDLERLLAWRHAQVAADLAAHRRWASSAPRTVAISGSHGLLGSALRNFLTTGGHTVLRLVRHAPQAGEIGWDPSGGRLHPRDLESVDAVVHLAGENLAGGRWTDERKRRLVASRTEGTAVIADALARAGGRARTLVSASAVGYYGDRGDEMLDETSGAGEGFLAELCRAWEAAAERATSGGVRVATPRFGVVLSPAGGALERMLPPFRLGAGGRLGGGTQWMSPVSIDDAVGIMHHLIMSDLGGAVNATMPQPVRNTEFTAQLARAVGRPAPFAIPAAALRLAFGQMAEETLLVSQRVVPRRLEAAGYAFRHPTVPAALGHVLGTTVAPPGA